MNVTILIYSNDWGSRENLRVCIIFQLLPWTPLLGYHIIHHVWAPILVEVAVYVRVGVRQGGIVGPGSDVL